MLSRIVVGSDGSGAAQEAVAFAADLAKSTGAGLTIVHAYREEHPHDPMTAYDPTLGSFPEMAELPDDVAHPVGKRAEVLASIEREVARAVEDGVKDVDSSARPGDPANVIIDVAEEVDADLIVVGNKGMTGASRFLLGSVPNKITHHAPCNVLVVKTT